MFSAHSGIVSCSHFHSQMTKKSTLDPYSQFHDPIHEKVSKMTPKWIPKDARNPPKIDKNLDLDPKVPCWAPLGAITVPQGAKMVPQSDTMVPPGLPNEDFGYPT